MDKKELYTIVAKAVKNDKNVSKDKLAVDLMIAGASLAMVTRELPKALTDNGIITPTSIMSEVNEHIKKSLKSWAIKSYEDVVARAEEVGKVFNLPGKKLIGNIRKAIGDKAPSRPKLGNTKQGIVTYISTYDKPSINGLSKYLQKECKLSEEKALMNARMNFAFAMACYKAK